MAITADKNNITLHSSLSRLMYGTEMDANLQEVKNSIDDLTNHDSAIATLQTDYSNLSTSVGTNSNNITNMNFTLSNLNSNVNSLITTIDTMPFEWSRVSDDNGGKPADNADVTVDKLNNGITTYGSITLTIDGSNKGKIVYNKSTYTDAVSGIYLGTDGFYAGDGVNNFISWDSTNGVKVGNEISITGNPSFFENVLRIEKNGFPVNFTDEYKTAVSNDGTVTQSPTTNHLTISIPSGGSANSYGRVYYHVSPIAVLEETTWDKNVSFTTKFVYLNTVVDGIYFIGVGSGSDFSNTSLHIGFLIDSSGIYGTCGDATNQSTVLLNATVTNNNVFSFRKNNTNIDFYINNSLVGSITTNVPNNPSYNIDYYFYAGLLIDVVSSSTQEMYIGSWRILVE
jgi:hypothetical protein